MVSVLEARKRDKFIDDPIKEYAKWNSLDVNENANRYMGPTGFFSYLLEKYMNETLLPLMPRNVLKAHMEGYIYVHKLPHSLYIPYCTGHSISRVLKKGLRTPTIISRPARHFDTYVDHIANYLITLQHYFTGAQAFSSVEWYAGPFIRNDKLGFKAVKQNIQRLIFNLNYPTRVGMQCLSEDTKILTPDGWKSYNEIKEGDLIYTFNLKTKRIELKPVRKIAIYEYNGIMYNLKNRTQDQLISPRHRVVWLSFNNHNIVRYSPIEDLLEYKSPIPIPTPAYTEYEGQDLPLSDDEIRLVAWILSDGNIEKTERGTPRITIIQSPKKYLKEIKELLDRLGLKYSEREDPGLGHAIALRLDAKSSKKVLEIIGSKYKEPPQWLYKLSRRQAKIFLDTFIKGDGWIEKNSNRIRIVTSNEAIKDSLVAVAILAGYNVSVSTRIPSDSKSKKEQYIITLTKTKTEYIQEIKKIEYNGIIWSVNTENETVIAMRNGCVFITGNTPFTNFTVTLDAPRKMLEGDHAIYDGRKVAPLGDFYEEAKTFILALTEILYEGDTYGQPFTFPIPTLMVTAKMIWEDPEVHEAIFKTAARRGSFYWLNTRIVDPDASFAMCCRINIDRNELLYAYSTRPKGLGLHFSLKKDLEQQKEESLKMIEQKRFGGLWAMPDITGSVNVTTINLPRIALEANGDDDLFWETYSEVLKIVRESEEWFRNRYLELMSKYPGMYAMIKEYLKEFPSSHFNTIGILGLPEAAAIYLQQPDLWKEGSRRDWLRAADVMKKMVEFAVEHAREWMKETGTPWNVEEVPGESAAAKLALKDVKKYPEVLEYLSDPNNPIYSTSIAPYYGALELPDRIEIESKVQKTFTGGVMMHIFLGEEPDPDALAKLTKRLIQTDLVYWSFTPAITHCYKCGRTFTGLYRRCPACGSENIEVWSRIIGYYRPLKNWNPYRRKEFWTRRHYK